MYFLVKTEEENPRSFKNPRKNPRASEKTPRNQDSIEKEVATLITSMLLYL